METLAVWPAVTVWLAGWVVIAGATGAALTVRVAALLFTVGEIADTIGGEFPHGSNDGRDGPIASNPGKCKCIVAIQFGIVHTGLAMTFR